MSKRIYLAHPLSPSQSQLAELEEIYIVADLREKLALKDNQKSAARWGAWIATTFRYAVSADWIWLSSVLEESPENRALGLSLDKTQIEACDELWALGPRISNGMAVEIDHAHLCKIPVHLYVGIPFVERYKIQELYQRVSQLKESNDE